PALFIRERPAPAVVARSLPAGQGRSSPFLQLLRRAVAGVGVAIGSEAADGLVVDRQSLGLAVGPERPTDLRALVPVEAEPAQRVDDDADGLVRGALAVGVLDPEDEDAAMVPGEKPVVEGGPGVADVQVAGGGR